MRTGELKYFAKSMPYCVLIAMVFFFRRGLKKIQVRTQKKSASPDYQLTANVCVSFFFPALGAGKICSESISKNVRSEVYVNLNLFFSPGKTPDCNSSWIEFYIIISGLGT